MAQSRRHRPERSRDWSYPKSDGPFRVRKKKVRDDKSPAIAYCGNCKRATFQTVIGDRNTSGVLRCNGCMEVHDFTWDRDGSKVIFPGLKP